MLESIQERIVGVMSIFSLLLTTIYILVNRNLRQERASLAFWTLGLGILGIIAMVYNIGCVLRGGCSMWAWFITILIGISTVLSIVGVFMIKDEEVKEDERTVRVARDIRSVY